MHIYDLITSKLTISYLKCNVVFKNIIKKNTIIAIYIHTISSPIDIMPTKFNFKHMKKRKKAMLINNYLSSHIHSTFMQKGFSFVPSPLVTTTSFLNFTIGLIPKMCFVLSSFLNLQILPSPEQS